MHNALQGGAREVGGQSAAGQQLVMLLCACPSRAAAWMAFIIGQHATQQVAHKDSPVCGYLSMQIFEPPRDLDGGGNQLVHLEAAPQVGALVCEPALVDGILGGKKCG